MHGVRPMKPSFALTLLICAYLAPVFLWPHAVNTAAGAAPDTPPAAAHRTGGRKSISTPQCPVRGAGNPRKRRRGAANSGDRRSAHRDPDMAWDRERAFAGMEGLRAEIVMLGGLHGAQRELLQWNRERIKTGRAPAVLPPRLCREMPLGAWCPLLPATFGVASRAPPDRPPCPPCPRLPQLKTPRRPNPETH